MTPEREAELRRFAMFDEVFAALDAVRRERDEARAALKTVEWASWEYSTGWSKCPSCHGWMPFRGGKDDRESSGHRMNCPIRKALAAENEGEEAKRASE